MATRRTRLRRPVKTAAVPKESSLCNGEFVLRLREARRIGGELRAPEFVLAHGRMLAGLRAIDIDKAMAAGEVYAALT